MFSERTSNNMTNNTHKRPHRVLLDDKIISFADMLTEINKLFKSL